MIKKLALVPIFFFLVVAIDVFLTKKMGTRYGNVVMPFIVILPVVGLLIYRAYILWDNASEIKDFTKCYKIPDPVFNLDLIDINDEAWIAYIKKNKQANKTMHAYSKKGASYARKKAKRMHV